MLDLGALARTIYDWQERAEQRHRLDGLDDRMLRDIGVDRASAKEEATKPFWVR
jgi:uncharacterized protein YjiS (DUF1127 family)